MKWSKNLPVAFTYSRWHASSALVFFIVAFMDIALRSFRSSPFLVTNFFLNPGYPLASGLTPDLWAIQNHGLFLLLMLIIDLVYWYLLSSIIKFLLLREGHISSSERADF